MHSRPSPPPPLPRPRRRSRDARGFTLVELLVAIMAGLFVSMAAFALSKQGARFFHQEARLAHAQFETLVGFERLRADVARAGYLSTPNIQAEPYRCPATLVATLPYGIRALGAVRIEQNAPADAQDAVNGLTPDRIFLTGSYTTDELFPVRAIQKGSGTGDEIYLNENFGPMKRLLQRAAAAGADEVLTAVRDVFAVGRAVRILDQSGGVSFGVIQSAQVHGTAAPKIVLADNTRLPFLAEAGGATQCGLAGNETGAQLSVLNWISYGLEPLTLEGFPGDDTAMQLVRRELDFMSASTENPLYLGGPETIAELVVDLRFGITHVAGPGTNPVMTTLDYGDTRIADIARDISAGVGLGPQHIRSIRARMSVRSREADRRQDLPTAAGNVLFRYQVADNLFARVRTTGADIQLPNLAEVTW